MNSIKEQIFFFFVKKIYQKLLLFLLLDNWVINKNKQINYLNFLLGREKKNYDTTPEPITELQLNSKFSTELKITISCDMKYRDMKNGENWNLLPNSELS